MGLVSVIVPSLNRATLIPHTLHSILGQSGNFEVIVVDDGSTDDTIGHLGRIFSSRLRILSTQDYGGRKGVSFSRNLGARHAVGDYLVFCDSDDLMLPGRLQNQSRFLKECSTVGIVFGNEFSLSGYDTVVYKKRFKPFSTLSHGGVFRRVKDYFGEASRIGNPVVRTAMIRRSIFDALGGFNESMMSGEDHEFIARLALSYDLYYSDQPFQIVRKGAYARLSTSSESISSRYFLLVKKLEEVYVPECKRKDYERLLNGWRSEAVFSAARDLGNISIVECMHLLEVSMTNIGNVQVMVHAMRLVLIRIRERVKAGLYRGFMGSRW